MNGFISVLIVSKNVNVYRKILNNVNVYRKVLKTDRKKLIFMSIVIWANDPLRDVIEAYEELYIEPVEILFVRDIKKERNAWGSCYFPPGATTQILLDVNCPYDGLIEILAHELAHAVTEDDHSPAWERVFTAINSKYCEIINRKYPTNG